MFGAEAWPISLCLWRWQWHKRKIRGLKVIARAVVSIIFENNRLKFTVRFGTTLEMCGPCKAWSPVFHFLLDVVEPVHARRLPKTSSCVFLLNGIQSTNHRLGHSWFLSTANSFHYSTYAQQLSTVVHKPSLLGQVDPPDRLSKLFLV